MLELSYEVKKKQSTKLQPLQLINPQGSPGIVPQGEGPQIHAQPSPWATTPMGKVLPFFENPIGQSVPIGWSHSLAVFWIGLGLADWTGLTWIGLRA